jgi:hypothetical protein
MTTAMGRNFTSCVYRTIHTHHALSYEQVLVLWLGDFFPIQCSARGGIIVAPLYTAQWNAVFKIGSVLVTNSPEFIFRDLAF